LGISIRGTKAKSITYAFDQHPFGPSGSLDAPRKALSRNGNQPHFMMMSENKAQISISRHNL